MRKSVLAILVFVLFLCVNGSSCFAQDSGAKSNSSSYTIDGLVASWKAAGLSVDGMNNIADPSRTAFFKSGAVVKLNGQNVQVYLYDLSKPDIARKFNEAKKTGKYPITTSAGKVVTKTGTAKGPLVVCGYEKHPNKDLILKTLASYNGSQDVAPKAGSSQSTDYSKYTLKGLFDYFAGAGLKVTEGTIEGDAGTPYYRSERLMYIGDVKYMFYIFDMKDAKAQKILEDGKKTGKYAIIKFGSRDISVTGVVNGPILMSANDEKPITGDLLTLFQKYKP